MSKLFGTYFYGSKPYSNGVYEAEIDTTVCNRTTNANLTIYIKVYFNQITPKSIIKENRDKIALSFDEIFDPEVTQNKWGHKFTFNDSYNMPYPIREWKPHEWKQWKRKVLQLSQKMWHGRFWLIPPKNYNGLNWPELRPTHRSNLYCQFEYTEVKNRKEATTEITVIALDGKHPFRHSPFLFSNEIINPIFKSGSLKLCKQTPILHEVGHLLGLEHPGIVDKIPGCSGASVACYVSAKGDRCGAMGLGDGLRMRFAKPWLKAAAILTDTREDEWDVKVNRYYPIAI